MVCISHDKLPVKIGYSPQAKMYRAQVEETPPVSDYDEASSVATAASCCYDQADVVERIKSLVSRKKRRKAANEAAFARLVDGWDQSRLHAKTSRSKFACLFENPASMMVWQGFVNMPEEVQQVYLATRPLDKIPEEKTVSPKSEDPRRMHPAANPVKRKVRPCPTFTKALIETIPEAEDFVQGLPNDGNAKHDREKDLMGNSGSADDPEIDLTVDSQKDDPEIDLTVHSQKDDPEIDLTVDSQKDEPEIDLTVDSQKDDPEIHSVANSVRASSPKDSSSESEDGFEKIPKRYASLKTIEDESS